MNVAASSEDANFTYVPKQCDVEALDADAAYVHVCTNETIGGVEYPLDAGHGRRAARRRHVVAHPLAADRRLEVRR